MPFRNAKNAVLSITTQEAIHAAQTGGNFIDNFCSRTHKIVFLVQMNWQYLGLQPYVLFFY